MNYYKRTIAFSEAGFTKVTLMRVMIHEIVLVACSPVSS